MVVDAPPMASGSTTPETDTEPAAPPAQKVVNAKRAWTAEEDEKLLEVVTKFAATDPGRSCVSVPLAIAAPSRV